MESVRQKQVAELIKRNFSLVLQSEGSYIYGSSVLVTVTSVKLTPDFNLAKIYLSVFNTENKQEAMLEMENELPRLKQSLANRIRKQIRRMPDIQLFLDDTVDEMYRVSAMFDKLYEENQMGKEEDKGMGG
jgi:ribosome-binding factor A